MTTRKYTNQASVPLSLAVFLATDNYDHEDDTISATALLKPTRQLILSQRVPQDLSQVDVMAMWKSRLGSAIHDSIEGAWLNGHEKALEALGYPKRVISKIKVNPKPEELTEDTIPVYMELRSYKEFMGYTVSGKFDFVAEGRVEDFKSTGTFTWVNGTKDEDYVLQGSIYRWLNPTLITSDQMQINFIFTDWQAFRAKQDPKYPQQPIMSKVYNLKPLPEIEAFIANKLREVEFFKDAEESELPLCSDKELWRSAPQFKYYKNPQKMSRSTKNFDNKQEAYSRLAKDGGVGTVVEVPGQVMACKYCPAFPICSQKDQLIADGSLKL